MNKFKTIYMASYYIGQPTVSVSKATGTLTIWEDRITFDKILGNSLANVSMIGMVIARSKTLKEGKTMTFFYSDIQKVRETKYMGFQPMLTIETKNGETHSFSAIFNASEVCTLIRQLMSDNHHNSGRQQVESEGTDALSQTGSNIYRSQPPSAVYRVLYYQGDLQPGPKKNGILRQQSDSLEFHETATNDLLRIPFDEIQRVDESHYMDMWPMLDITMKTGSVHHFFDSKLPSDRLKACIELQLKQQPMKTGAHGQRICKYCGHVYEKEDIFCTECGGAETIIS